MEAYSQGKGRRLEAKSSRGEATFSKKSLTLNERTLRGIGGYIFCKGEAHERSRT